jgi:hypothetical protein
MAVAVARPLQSGNGKHIDVEVTLRSFVRLIEQAVPSAILRQAGGLDRLLVRPGSRTHQKRSTRLVRLQWPMHGAKLRSMRRHRACGLDGSYGLLRTLDLPRPFQCEVHLPRWWRRVPIAPGEDTLWVRVTVGFDIAR